MRAEIAGHQSHTKMLGRKLSKLCSPQALPQEGVLKFRWLMFQNLTF